MNRILELLKFVGDIMQDYRCIKNINLVICGDPLLVIWKILKRKCSKNSAA
jgi:hypothetical protein